MSLKFKIQSSGTYNYKRYFAAGSTLKLYSIKREVFKDEISNEIFNNSVFYILYNDVTREVYVGECDNAQKRLPSHHSGQNKKDFWNQVFIFVCEDFFNKTIVQYIEHMMIDYLNDSSTQCTLINNNRKERSSLTEQDEDNIESSNIIDYIIYFIKNGPELTIFDPVVKQKINFEQEITQKPLASNIKILSDIYTDYDFLPYTFIRIAKPKNDNYRHADAKVRITTDGQIILLKGSKVSYNITDKYMYIVMRNDLIKTNKMVKMGNFYYIQDDIPCSSPTFADDLISGTHGSGANKLIEETSGKTLKSMLLDGTINLKELKGINV